MCHPYIESATPLSDDYYYKEKQKISRFCRLEEKDFQCLCTVNCMPHYPTYGIGWEIVGD